MHQKPFVKNILDRKRFLIQENVYHIHRERHVLPTGERMFPQSTEKHFLFPSENFALPTVKHFLQWKIYPLPNGETISKNQYFAKFSLNSTQLQLKLRLRLALFQAIPATHDSSFLGS